ncbi:MAG: hypothetical protein HZA12_05620 [Nitrospirae bacterium]|nr:hypothetical protein [Nitrospirota bacterium]
MDKKKIDIIAIISIGAIFVLFYSLFLKDDIFLYRSLSSQRASLKSAVIRDLALIEAHKGRQSEIMALEKEIKGNMDMLQKENAVPYFLNYLSSLAGRYRVGLLSIEPGEVLEGGLFTKSIFTTTMSGGFFNIYNFLYHLEDDWQGVKVERLTIDKNPGDNKVDVRLTLAVLSI